MRLRNLVFCIQTLEVGVSAKKGIPQKEGTISVREIELLTGSCTRYAPE